MPNTTAPTPPPIFEGWQIIALAAILPIAWLLVWLILAPTRAEAATGYLAVALVCPAGIEGPDCSRDTAHDMAVQPVTLVTECAQVGMLLAAHLTLQPGERHKIVCERRRG